MALETFLFASRRPQSGTRKAPMRRGLAPLAALSILAPLLASQQTRRGDLEEAPPVNRLARQLALPGLPNIIIILVDDFGVDLFDAYDEHPMPAKTPNMDALAADGVLFRNAYSAPVCSPARSMLMTGRRSRQTGIGLFNPQNSPIAVALDNELVTIPEMIGGDYRRGAFGKWHLTIESYDGEFGAGHPLDQGFETHMGVGWGVSNGCLVDDMPQPRGSYTDYCIFVDGLYMGESGQELTVYNTTNTTNNAKAFIDAAIEANEPFFAYIPYQAPHSPYHIPPASLLSAATNTALTGIDVDDPANIPLLVRAMAEALDTEIGRLLESIEGFPESENTYVFLIGDNGTIGAATTAPFDPLHGKATAYEGGINIPFVVTGPGVMSGECLGLVSIIDVFATVAQITDSPSFSAPDSISMVPYFANPNLPTQRECLFVEIFEPNFDPDEAVPGEYDRFEQAIRDVRFKLIRKFTNDGPIDEFYDLLADPFEASPMDTGTLTGRALDAYTDFLEKLPGVPENLLIRI